MNSGLSIDGEVGAQGWHSERTVGKVTFRDTRWQLSFPAGSSCLQTNMKTRETGTKSGPGQSVRARRGWGQNQVTPVPAAILQQHGKEGPLESGDAASAPFLSQAETVGWHLKT